MLCWLGRDIHVVFNVPTEQQQRPATDGVTDKVQLTAPGYSTENGNSNCCFAGDDDELVVASSSDRNMYIWSVPEGRGDQTINQSLLSLTGHPYFINHVRYCKATSTLASISFGAIKLWTPAAVSSSSPPTRRSFDRFENRCIRKLRIYTGDSFPTDCVLSPMISFFSIVCAEMSFLLIW